MDKFSEKNFDYSLEIREDLDEIFQDLLDIGFSLNTSTYYITKDFTQVDVRTLPRLDFYYYGLIINLERKIGGDDKSHNWSGSLYYEESPSLLEILYSSISRLKSTYPDYKIYYNFRGTNDVNIKIIIGSYGSKNVEFDYFKLKNYLSTNLCLDINESIDFSLINSSNWGDTYRYDLTLSKGNLSKSVESLKLKLDKSKSKSVSNINEIYKIFDSIIEELKKYLGKGFSIHSENSENTQYEHLRNYYIFIDTSKKKILKLRFNAESNTYTIGRIFKKEIVLYTKADVYRNSLILTKYFFVEENADANYYNSYWSYSFYNITC